MSLNVYADQDVHLENLSRSINRQRDISVQINGELEVHTGLLEQLDAEVDDTQGRLSGARRRLDRFSRGAKENGNMRGCLGYPFICADVPSLVCRVRCHHRIAHIGVAHLDHRV